MYDSLNPIINTLQGNPNEACRLNTVLILSISDHAAVQFAAIMGSFLVNL